MFVGHFNFNSLYCFVLISCLVPDVRLQDDAPKLLSVSVTDVGGVYLVWEPVQYNVSEPILGYKIKIWEVKEKVERMFKLIHGEVVPGLIEEFKAEEDFGKDSIPSEKPKIFKAGPYSNNLEIAYIKPDVLLEIRIQTYKQNEDGQYSEPWRLKVFKYNGQNAIVQRYNDKCVLTVPSQVKSMFGKLPHIYNSYI